MPESRLERTRATLPPRYQFGDAAAHRPIVMCRCDDWLTCEHPYPVMLGTFVADHLATLTNRREYFTANVIEGDRH